MKVDMDTVPGNSGGAVSSESGATAVGIYVAEASDGEAVMTHIQYAEDESGWLVMTTP